MPSPAPATPQRARPPTHAQSHSVSHYRSPMSPNSPYTPLSLRSFASSGPSSTLTTPASSANYASVAAGVGRKLSYHSASATSSPLAMKNPSRITAATASPNSDALMKEKSLADIALNWRSRAHEHGIRVSSDAGSGNDSFTTNNDSFDQSFSEVCDNSSFIDPQDGLLPAPFLSTQRRRSASLSQPHSMSVPVINRNRRNGVPPASPLARKALGPVKPNTSVTATPPPNRNLAKRLKLKGSQTDPAQPRRREAFGIVPQLSQNIPTERYNNLDAVDTSFSTSFDLFDIDENDFEHDEYQFGNDFATASEVDMDSDYHTHPNPLRDNVNNAEPRNLNLDVKYPTIPSPSQEREDSQFTHTHLGALSQPHMHPLQVSAQQASYMNMNLGIHPQAYSTVHIPSYPHLQQQQFMTQGIPHMQALHSRRVHPALHSTYPYGQTLSIPTLPTIPSLPTTPVLPAFGLGSGQPTFADPFINTLCSPVDIGADANDVHASSPASVSEELFGLPLRSSTPVNGHQMSAADSLGVEANGSQTAEVTEQEITTMRVPTNCSVCSRVNPARLAILAPCGHPLCSACLTSALNIVGEKDMECAVCRSNVEDFKLITITASQEREDSSSAKESKDDANQTTDENHTTETKGLCLLPSSAGRRTPLSDLKNAANADSSKGKSFFDPLFSSPGSVASSALDIDNSLEDRFRTPQSSARNTSASYSFRSSSLPVSRTSPDAIVLRIDNVPWDITPPAIAAWLQQPIQHAHVLLDRKGKTLSHAFVEVASEDIAGAILRGEATGRGELRSGSINEKKSRGTVLGRGRRARGVTVTRSSQEELMAALFPSWRGTFDGARPSLAGLGKDRVVSALECGLMSDADVSSLLYLIRSPDAHFLKVPSLPFYSLINIISKFPSDVDSRVFWSTNLRDALYDVTYTAGQILLARLDGQNNTEVDNSVSKFPPELFESLLETGIQCKAFTSQQIADLTNMLEYHRKPQSHGPTDEQYDSDSIASSRNQSFADADDGAVNADVEDARVQAPNNNSDDETSEQSSRCYTPNSSTAASAVSSSLDPAIASSDAGGLEESDRAAQDLVGQDISAVPSDDVQMSDLAKEFGVGTELVQALAQRLANAGLC